MNVRACYIMIHYTLISTMQVHAVYTLYYVCLFLDQKCLLWVIVRDNQSNLSETAPHGNGAILVVSHLSLLPM